MKQKVIKITEQDIYRIVKKCITEALDEYSSTGFERAARLATKRGRHKLADKLMNAATNAANRDYNGAAQMKLNKELDRYQFPDNFLGDLEQGDVVYTPSKYGSVVPTQLTKPVPNVAFKDIEDASDEKELKISKRKQAMGFGKYRQDRNPNNIDINWRDNFKDY